LTAEGYGLLANLRLVFQILTFYDLPLVFPPITVVTDNEGLFHRIKSALSSKYIQPRRFLSSEIDLEMQIVDTLRLLHADVSFSHVLGHQDNTVDAIEEL
jgi:hypothetical protein